MDYVTTSDANTQTIIAKCEQHAQLLNEEVYARTQGLQIAELQGQNLQTELARIQLLLALEKIILQSLTQLFNIS